MNLFIDCEWNGFGGELISIALVPEDRLITGFYAVLPCENPVPWVNDNVLKVLHEAPEGQHRSDHPYRELSDTTELQAALGGWLSKLDAPEVNIVADWPEDIARFCDLLITGPGSRMNTPDIKFQIFRVDADSELPHNAYWDAIGLRDRWSERTVVERFDSARLIGAAEEIVALGELASKAIAEAKSRSEHLEDFVVKLNNDLCDLSI